LLQNIAVLLLNNFLADIIGYKIDWARMSYSFDLITTENCLESQNWFGYIHENDILAHMFVVPAYNYPLEHVID